MDDLPVNSGRHLWLLPCGIACPLFGQPLLLLMGDLPVNSGRHFWLLPCGIACPAVPVVAVASSVHQQFPSIILVCRQIHLVLEISCWLLSTPLLELFGVVEFKQRDRFHQFLRTHFTFVRAFVVLSRLWLLYSCVQWRSLL